MIGEFVIVRSRDQGVMVGVLQSLVPQPGGLACAVLASAQQLHHWQQNNQNYTLVELANHGVQPPATARISEPAEMPVTVFGVCGVLPCTEDSRANLSQARWNAPYLPSALPPRAKKPRG
jgi:hypothetical protein